jgi:hypothetical protein
MLVFVLEIRVNIYTPKSSLCVRTLPSHNTPPSKGKFRFLVFGFWFLVFPVIFGFCGFRTPTYGSKFTVPRPVCFGLGVWTIGTFRPNSVDPTTNVGLQCVRYTSEYILLRAVCVFVRYLHTTQVCIRRGRGNTVGTYYCTQPLPSASAFRIFGYYAFPLKSPAWPATHFQRPWFRA